MFSRLLAPDPRSPATRTAALLALAAYAVHELRYAIAYGDAAHMLEEHGHSYMSALVPILGLLLALGLGSWVAALARARRDGLGEAETRGLGSTWLAASGSLIAIFAFQETLEGLFSPGHGSGLAAVFGSGGWTAVPLALVFGAGIALLLRGARAATRRVANWKPMRVWRWTLPRAGYSIAFAETAPHPRACVLARNGAGRAPPFTS